MWIGFIIIAIGAFAVITGAFDFSAAKFSTWGNGTSFFEQATGGLLVKLILTAVVLGVLFTVGNRLMGTSVKTYLPAFLGLFVLTVAGTALGETAQTVAVLVKSIQNILIGFIAFAVAVFFATKVENNGNGSGRKIGASEIWYRLPKFILGFFAASLLASFVVLPAVGKETVSAINGVLDQYKNWAFVLVFTSIGLDTNFRELKEQFQGGKPLTLYVVGQLFNIVLTFAAVYLLLSGKFFPLPNLAV